MVLNPKCPLTHVTNCCNKTNAKLIDSKFKTKWIINTILKIIRYLYDGNISWNGQLMFWFFGKRYVLNAKRCHGTRQNIFWFCSVNIGMVKIFILFIIKHTFSPKPTA